MTVLQKKRPPIMGVFYFEEPKIRRKIGIRSIGYFSEISLSVSRISINFGALG
ncbi:MAG: hypothetical protein RL705_922 [Bacteroidota bacterium]